MDTGGLSAKFSSDAGQKVKAAVINMLASDGSPGLGVRSIANAAAALVASVATMAMAIFIGLFDVATVIATLFLEGFDEGRKANQTALNGLIAAALSDLLSIEVDPSDLPAGGDQAAQIQRAVAIGGKLHELLEGAFGGSPGPTDDPGAKGARAFSGFLINAATGSALLGIIGEMESLGFFKEWHLLGEDILQSLGLSRLSRRALGPLVDTLIVKPYTRYLAEKYTPDHLSVPQVLTAFNAGRMDESTMQKNLARLGFNESYIVELQAQHIPKLSLADVDAMVRWGKWTREAGVQQLRDQGWPAQHAEDMLTAMELQRADSVARAYAEEIFSLARDRHLDPVVYGTLLDRLPLHETEKQQRRDRLGVWLDTAHKRLSIGEVIYLLERNQLTEAYVQQWAIDSGYSQDDAFLLGLYVDLKDLEYEAKQKAKAAREAAAAAKKAKAGGGGAPPAG